MIEETDTLRQQVMINQFTAATGCTVDQARQILQSSRWEFETALSVFFQEAAVQNPHLQRRHAGSGQLVSAAAPANTPATPPNLPDALLAFQTLGVGSAEGAWSPAVPMTGSGGTPAGGMPFQQSHNGSSAAAFPALGLQPKVLSSWNSVSSNERYSNCDCPTATGLPSGRGHGIYNRLVVSPKGTTVHASPMAAGHHHRIYGIDNGGNIMGPPPVPYADELMCEDMPVMESSYELYQMGGGLDPGIGIGCPTALHPQGCPVGTAVPPMSPSSGFMAGGAKSENLSPLAMSPQGSLMFPIETPR